MHGPNGFFRQFGGSQPDAAADKATLALPEVSIVPGRRPDELKLLLVNKGERACTVSLVANHYAESTPSHYPLAPGAQLEVVRNLAACEHWYDLSVTCDTDPRFLRRFAGHLETGHPSLSDPALSGRNG